MRRLMDKGLNLDYDNASKLFSIIQVSSDDSIDIVVLNIEDAEKLAYEIMQTIVVHKELKKV